LSPQVSGTLAVDGLSTPVRVVRDRWGVPHIKAGSQDDLFFAQGFVQAQDRLFQMDLWRRSVQGRLSEVLGPNFIDRDAMTRRVQYRGELDVEWASYGPDTKAIASAFTRGINAWVELARERLPEEFVLAGWAPEFWRPEDLLNRTDAFVSSHGAQDEVFRARLVTAVGVARADRLLPAARGPTVVPRGLDEAVVSDFVADVLRRVGTAPFFVSLAAPLPSDLGGSNAWAVARGDAGAPLLAGDPHRALQSPSLRYLVHLEGPGWNVIGATAPWLPGVAIGHNDRIAWSMTAAGADTQDLYVEKLNPANIRQFADRGRFVDMVFEKEAVAVKGSKESFEYERQYTPHGIVIAVDRDRNLAYTIRWSGAEPGAAAELGALAIDRARSWSEFRSALACWKMPSAEFVYADADGHVGRQLVALTPARRGWTGTLPVPGDSREYEWRGWTALDDLPHAQDPASGFVASASDSRARLNRIGETLELTRSRGIEAFKQLQHDVLAWNAQQLVPLLSSVHAERADVEDARQRLVRWDRRLTVDSPDASLYVTWERTLIAALAARRVPSELMAEFVTRASFVVVPALVHPSRTWFDGKVDEARDTLLLTSLTAAVDELQGGGGPGGAPPPWGQLHGATFAHPLGITERARRRFNIGPLPVPGYAETVFSTPVAGPERSVGPSFSTIFDLGDWDRSVANNPPGQSGSAGSPHFSDLAPLWAAGEYIPLSFGDRAVQANAESTLTLVPR
jgi:penicillin G amidase